MAKRLNIVIPARLDAWLVREVESGGFGTPSEYIRHLLLRAQVERSTKSVDALLIEGEASGKAKPMTDRDWAAIRRRTEARAANLRKQASPSKRRKSA